MQASRFVRLLFDPFPLFQNGFVTPEVDICGCDFAQALVVALVVVVIDKGFDLGFEIAGQELVFQQDAALQSLMPPVNFALVIPPFLMGLSRRIYAAVFSFMAGVIPPMPMLGRSLLYVQSHSVAWSCTSSMVSKIYWPNHSPRTVRL